MNEIMAIIKKNLKETVHSKLFLLHTAGFIFLIVFFIAKIPKGDEIEKTGPELIDFFQTNINLSFFLVALIVAFITAISSNQYTLLAEKTKRTLESLLCTPVRLQHVWIGKTISVIIPGIILGLALTLLAFCAFNILIISPEIGRWVFPEPASMVATLIGMPIFILSFSALLNLLMLILTHFNWALYILMGIFMVILFGGKELIESEAIEISSSSLASWPMLYIALAIAAVPALVTIILSRLFLTKERVILSSKG